MTCRFYGESWGFQVPFIQSRSKNFCTILTQALQFAATPYPVLILGETGVGKELLARFIHSHSTEKTGPFVAVNCGAIPTPLFESELFGHERGAFSGAVQASRGLIRSALTGTLFLDELGELDNSNQVKLLRFLDQGEIRPVGSARTERVSVRLLAATNADLYTNVREDHFRLDLLERFSILTLSIPPLRERKEDIGVLIDDILAKMKINTPMEPDAVEALQNFDWPGNVRQLRNVLIRAAILDSSAIKHETIEKILGEERATCFPGRHQWGRASLAEIEKQVIVDRLRHCNGNRKQTAKELGIAKSTLQEKLKRWKNAESWIHCDVAEPPLVM